MVKAAKADCVVGDALHQLARAFAAIRIRRTRKRTTPGAPQKQTGRAKRPRTSSQGVEFDCGADLDLVSPTSAMQAFVCSDPTCEFKDTAPYSCKAAGVIPGKIYHHSVDGRLVMLNVKQAAQPKRWSCQHGRQRSQCKECGGGSICPHQRRRSQCKECGGGSICPH
jgi:hypothetical protein